MKISNDVNSRSKSTSFGRLLVLDFSQVPESKMTNVLYDIKQQIGNGIVDRFYTKGRESIVQKVFVGFNPSQYDHGVEKIDEVIISSGNDKKIPESHLGIKRESVDNPILSAITNIFTRNNIGSEAKIFMFDDYSGGISRTEDYLTVRLSGENFEKLNQHSIKTTGKPYSSITNYGERDVKFVYDRLGDSTYSHKGIAFVNKN